MQRGQTALIRAAATGVPTFVRILLNAGANADAKDIDVRIIHVMGRCISFLFSRLDLLHDIAWFIGQHVA